MTTVIYAIVFNGEVLAGFQELSVKAQLSKLLKVDAGKMNALFSGKQVVLKRTADKTEAVKIGNALRKIGADVKVKVIKSEARAKPAQRPEAPAAAASQLSLAPNEGNLVEPKPSAPPPKVDLSEYSLAQNDDSPLVEPSDDEPPMMELDLSRYSVAENDGSPLVEPSGEAPPPVQAPDFGLDEPGALLDTVKEEKEEVNPDISGLSLAEPGTDLLSPEEREREKIQPANVDTGDLDLETNPDT